MKVVLAGESLNEDVIDEGFELSFIAVTKFSNQQL
jgi:hypothetical protein